MESINNKIIRELFEEGWLEKHCRAACPTNKALADDLIQEVALVILEYKDTALLENLYDRKEHYRFIKRIICNYFKSTTSPFWYKYRKHTVNQVEIIDDMLPSYEDEYLEY